MSVLSALTGSNSNAAVVKSSAPKAEQVETWSHDDDIEVIRYLDRRKPKSQHSQDNQLATCRDCRKTFKRPCDLTKHQKTHSRLWKCHEEKCKYHYLGWPTEKERDRHVTDKHSSAPTQYKCLYPPCAYASKRESNCKQHMEKAHGWVYVRSKSHGRKKISHTNHATLPSAPLIYFKTNPKSYPRTATTTPASAADWRPKLRASCNACAASKVKCSKEHPICARCKINGSQCMFSVFSDSYAPSTNDNYATSTKDSNATSTNDSYATSTKDSYATSTKDSYAASTDVSIIPDDSGQFDEGFADGEPASLNDLVDFTLFSPLESSTLSGSVAEQSGFTFPDLHSALDFTLSDTPTPIEAKNTGEASSSSKETQPLEVSRREPAPHTDNESSFNPKHDSSKEFTKVPLPELSATDLDPNSSGPPEEVEPVISGLPRTIPIPDQIKTLPGSTKRSFDVDTNGDETLPPVKRVKKCTPKRGKLRLMSCIYRKHKPETYNYNDSKFKTCHTTSHEYISTLVRHLERYHSAVLCHTCLSAFEDVKDKDKHKETTKCKAAYGSQEDKWQMLYKTLCGDGNQHSPYFECTSEQSPPAASMETQQISQGTPPEDKAKPPTSESSAHRTAFVSSGQLVALSTPVPLNNTERGELERLREENNRLLRENNALLRRVLQWESVYATIDTSTVPMSVVTQV